MTHLQGIRSRELRLPLAMITILSAAAMLLAGASSAQAKSQVCPNTFTVLHNDQIGNLKLPAGPYTITVFKPNALGCAKASKLFTKFLQDWDGKLPDPWTYKVNKSGDGDFIKNDRGVGFNVKRQGGGGGGGGDKGSLRCNGYFTVLHNDKIGKLRLPAGQYQVTRLTKNSQSCDRITNRLFPKFLMRGDVPKGWAIKRQSASFYKKKTGRGFRVKLIKRK
jgi:DNA gyrase inhibitor GyrI